MTPERAYNHCLENGRNSELEKIIITSPEWAYNYADHVIKDRWIEAEKIIINDPYCAYLYARDVIQGRWIEAESVIATDSGSAFYYALDIIKGKLPENMHNAMLLHYMNDDFHVKYYLKFIKNKPPTV